MRSAEQAHVSIIRHSSAHLLLVRVVMAVVSTAVLLLVWRPAVIRAQGAPEAEQQPPQKAAPKPVAARDTASTTHVVKPGETLWSIATRYYGDGHQWRAVARRNGIELSGGTGIRVGSTLIIPSRKTVVASASTLPARTDTTTPRAATAPAGPPAPAPVTTPGMAGKPPATSGTLAAQTAPKAAAPAEPPSPDVQKAEAPQDSANRLFVREASRISVISNSDMRAARSKGETPTVFLLNTASASDVVAAAQTVTRSQQPGPRTAELFAAPIVIAESQWASMGRVMKRIDGTIPESPQPGRMHLADRVDITAPAGVRLAVGDRLLALRPAGLVNQHVSVVIPTGVLEVTNVGTGPLVRVYVRSLSGPLEEGQAILPVTASPPPAGVVPTPSTGDIETSITWTEKGELLPTVESYAVIAAGDAEGVKAGDLFELVRSSEQGAEERLAIARVLRVGPLGSSVILTKQWRAGIKPGIKARRVARMP